MRAVLYSRWSPITNTRPTDSISRNKLSMRCGAIVSPFTSTAVQPRDGGWSLDGQLTVAGVQRPARIDVDLAEAGDLLSLSALVPVVQTEHGVKPYSAMMGALKLRDRVDVRVAATVPRP